MALALLNLIRCISGLNIKVHWCWIVTYTHFVFVCSMSGLKMLPYSSFPILTFSIHLREREPRMLLVFLYRPGTGDFWMYRQSVCAANCCWNVPDNELCLACETFWSWSFEKTLETLWKNFEQFWKNVRRFEIFRVIIRAIDEIPNKNSDFSWTTKTASIRGRS